MTIQEIIKMLAKSQFDELYAIPCTVSSYDPTAKTCVCSPVNGDADIIDVKVQALTGKGVLIIPTVGSVVIVGMVNSVTGYIAMYSDVDSIQFLDGSYGGLVRVDSLITKINNLENKVNDLVSKFNAHVHTGVTTGAGSSGPTTTPSSGSLTPTSRGEIENQLVTHGHV